MSNKSAMLSCFGCFLGYLWLFLNRVRGTKAASIEVIFAGNIFVKDAFKSTYINIGLSSINC